jgi:hypothetical protein
VLPVGNAAFHSAELYPLLSRSIEPLTVSLRDDDDKTRANAAGAIGNLIRNGGELSQLMADLRVVEMLIFMLVNDADITAQRIALFSLGTMAVYPATRSGAFPVISLIAFCVWVSCIPLVFTFIATSFLIVYNYRASITNARSPSIAEAISHLKNTLGSDEMIQKYVLRLRQKLKSPLQPQEPSSS